MPFGRRSFLLRPFLMAPSPGGARGFTPSRALPWGRKTRPSVPNVAARVLRISITLVSFPRRRGCERVHTLSRSPMGSQVAAKCAKRCRARPRNFESTRFSPASPGVREGSHPLALSHGVARRGRVRHTLPRASSEFRIDSFFSRFAGGARGSTPSRALPWGRKTRPSAPYVAARALRISIAPFLSRAAGGARGFTPSRALPWGRESQPRATEHSSPLNAAKSPLRTCLIY